jgi:hypothetical protein
MALEIIVSHRCDAWYLDTVILIDDSDDPSPRAALQNLGLAFGALRAARLVVSSDQIPCVEVPARSLPLLTMSGRISRDGPLPSV